MTDDSVAALLAADAEWANSARPLVWDTLSDDRARRLAAAVEAAVMQRLLVTPGGELVRQTWVYWAMEQPDVAEHPDWLKSWVEIDERDREVDDRIYSAVAVKAVHDARLRNERLELEAATLHAHLPAILGALRAALCNAPYESLAKPYRAALMAFRADEGQERSDEKEAGHG